MTLSVHPRLRGELFARKGDEIGYTGSSPLTRGTLTCKLTEGQYIAVHPRLRGELSKRYAEQDSIRRFIPAYAGNSRDKVVKNISITVHPRLRGELKNLSANVRCFIGSSPLTRGTRLSAENLAKLLRFIPAYAGNSSCLSFLIVRASVHPRLRGELT